MLTIFVDFLNISKTCYFFDIGLKSCNTKLCSKLLEYVKYLAKSYSKLYKLKICITMYLVKPQKFL